MPTLKHIAYAYPSSPAAERAGRAKVGGWYIQVDKTGPDGEWFNATHPGTCCEMFDAPNDPELIALFLETEGIPHPADVRYNPDRYAFLA